MQHEDNGLIARFTRYMWRNKSLSDKRKIQWYPPFFLMRVKVLDIRDNWRQVRLKLPLNTFSKNPGGVMFGGYQACLADPIAALACARVFPGYSVWTRAMSVDFQVGGSTDLELRFDFPPEMEKAIAAELEERGRATPTFEYGFYLADGRLCTKITNTVAIRPKGYVKATTPGADDEWRR
ncbi:MAG: PaaI family thioesterase [Gammaproteobacteria bacterium]|nr:PaaI family thioesterase [Gammaproteobacteria bacterium]